MRNEGLSEEVYNQGLKNQWARSLQIVDQSVLNGDDCNKLCKFNYRGCGQLQTFLVKGIKSKKKVNTKKQICAGYKIRKTKGLKFNKAVSLKDFRVMKG